MSWMTASTIVFYSLRAARKVLSRPECPATQGAWIVNAGYSYTSHMVSLLIWSSAMASAIGTFVMLAMDYIGRNGEWLWGALSLRHKRTGRAGEDK